MAEVIAMRVCTTTQNNSFRQFNPSCLWLSHSCPRPSSSFPRPFPVVAYSRSLHRREVCTIQSACCTYPTISLFGSSLCSQHCYHLMPSNVDMSWKLVISPSTKSARMVRGHNFNYQQKVDKAVMQVSGSSNGTQICELGDIASKPKIPGDENGWEEETKLVIKRKKECLKGKCDVLQDDNFCLRNQDYKGSDPTNIRSNGPPYKSNYRLPAIAENGGRHDFIPYAEVSTTMKDSNINDINQQKCSSLIGLIKNTFLPMEDGKRTDSNCNKDKGDHSSEKIAASAGDEVKTTTAKEGEGAGRLNLQEKLSSINDKVLVVDNISVAKQVVRMLTRQYRNFVHACDTEVAKIDVKQETPVDHGELICFSIYSGREADFGNGKSCIWVDVLDGGGRDLLVEFAPFFEDPSIRKVWHNYSFDNHIIENYGLKVSGFHADTMHMARLWDSSRRMEGGYSLDALTGDQRVMEEAVLKGEGKLIGKVSMKTIFGKKKVKKDGSEGKIITIAPVEELQRKERESWISYSALDAMSTLNLYESLKIKLSEMAWSCYGKSVPGKSMFDFYQEYWQPFGEILVRMEAEGMLVDRKYLAEMEKVAKAEQEVAVNRFRNWASKYCPDAKYMNVGSDTQLRQLFFGGIVNRKDANEFLEFDRNFKVPNVDKVIEKGKKTPTKYRSIKLHRLSEKVLPTEMYTATGWPSVCGDALKALAGKVSSEYDFMDDACDSPLEDNIDNTSETMTDDASESQKSTACVKVDTSAYGTAFTVFGGGDEGREACHAIASLCEVCSIDSLISNFILPLQGSIVSGKDGRVHCSLNINTQTGRLSARRPNLQNQPALEKDRYKIRQAFIASPGNSLIVADYGQLELRILAHLANCESMIQAFKAGGDFHSRTAMNMYPHIREAIENKQVLLEWHPQHGEDKPPVPLLKDAFASERRKAKMLNFSIAYGKTPVGLARDWKVSVDEAQETVNLWYNGREEVLKWQEKRKQEAMRKGCVHTLLGRARRFPLDCATRAQRNHIGRAAINTPVQGSAADVAMCAMLEISNNGHLKELGWRLLLQVHDEVILEGPSESAQVAKAIVVECMSKPFNGKNILKVDLAVDAKCAQNWYSAK